MMNIAIGLPFDLKAGDLGGFSTSFKTILKGLEGHEVIVFAPRGGDVKLVSENIFDGSINSKQQNTIFLSKDFARKMNDIDFDNILAFTDMGLYLNKNFVYFTSNVPYKKVLKIANGEFPNEAYFNEFLEFCRQGIEQEKVNFNRAERILVFSSRIKKDLIKEYGISPEKIKYIPRPIPKITLQNNVGVEKNIENSKKMKIILMPSELRIRKGVRYAIETMKVLKKEIPNAVLLICGKINPYEKEFIFSLLEEARGKANIILAGYLPKNQFYSYMKTADCAFMPFLFDECPIAISECIGHNLPIVTNEYSGYEKEIINKVGYCAKHNDVEDYVFGLTKMLNDLEFNLNKQKGAKEVAKKLNFNFFKEELNNAFKT